MSHRVTQITQIMKCSACMYWKKSQMHGNHCVCMGPRPCDRDRRDKMNEHRRKHNQRHRRWE